MENSKSNETSYDFIDKYSEKMFAGISGPATLLAALTTYTKSGLNLIRIELGLSGLSALNKEKLVIALEKNIKKYLSDVLNKFTERDLFFIKAIMKNNGILLFEEEFIDEVQYLRQFGIIGFYKDNSSEKYIYIPIDILSDINELLIDLKILPSISQNEMVNSLEKVNRKQQILSVEKGNYNSLSLKSVQAIHVKIGRNSPCPCGSGKKYKFCCLK